MRKPFYWLLFFLVFGAIACQQAVEPLKKASAASPVSASVKQNSAPARIGKIVLSPGKIISFQYGPQGEIIQSDLTDSLKRMYGIMASHWTFVYDSAGHLDKLVSEDGTGIEITTDSTGHITKSVRSLAGMLLFQNSCSYDPAGRLSVFKNVTMAGASNTFTYAYASNGNLATVYRSGNPSALNFSLQATAYDERNSLWHTDIQSSIIYWWLVTLTQFADQSPALFLSYNNNVTEAIYTNVQSQQTALKIDYGYIENNPVLMRPLQATDSTVFRGPYEFEYESYL